MPKYKYRCGACSEEWEQWHRVDENPQACECGEHSNLQRLPPSFTTTKTKEVEKKIGDVTEEHIKESRKKLKNQKEEAIKEEFK
jgi:putative FmdB family regulatory protein